jgi:hypothetical protein
MSVIFLVSGLENDIEFYLQQSSLFQTQSNLKVTFIGPRVRNKENPHLRSLHSFVEMPIDPMV